MSEELATYTGFPGLASVIRVYQVVRNNLTGQERDSVQYGVSSLSDLAPDRALALLRGHWEIENRLFYVKDDGFGEDRQVLQYHHSGLGDEPPLRGRADPVARQLPPLVRPRTPHRPRTTPGS